VLQIPFDARIYVAGHRGLVGSAILRRLREEGFSNLLTATREQLELRDQAAVNYWFKANRPTYVFMVAGTVGGILANSTRPAEFIYDNLMIHAALQLAQELGRGSTVATVAVDTGFKYLAGDLYQT
jgi:GDP-L-fucose synthase